MKLLSGFLSLALAFGSFPEYDDPITEEPLLVRPSTASQTVMIFENVACKSWNEIFTNNFQPPAAPSSGSWSKIIMDMTVLVHVSLFLIYHRLQRMEPNSIAMAPFGLVALKFFEQPLLNQPPVVFFGLLRKI
jgi:hypothetical protein